MRRGQHSPRLTSAHFPDLYAHNHTHAPAVTDAVESQIISSGLAPEFLKALPGEARHEYLAAYRRARHLSDLPAAGACLREQGSRS